MSRTEQAKRSQPTYNIRDKPERSYYRYERPGFTIISKITSLTNGECSCAVLRWRGSRGNPGPGGAGACIVRVDAPSGASTIVWSAAMSHGHSSTTNSQAEYRGLLHGLRAAHRHQWAHLEVVGDSDLIIRQHLFYRPPENARLLHLYAETRRLADQLGVVRWTHHVRAFNTMAASLANYAMDTRTSSQTLHPTARPGHTDIRARLSNDLDPWLPDFLGRRVE